MTCLIAFVKLDSRRPQKHINSRSEENELIDIEKRRLMKKPEKTMREVRGKEDLKIPLKMKNASFRK